MKFEVITPFQRYQNKNILTNHLREFNIIWRPIIDDKDWVLWYSREEWIFPHVYHKNGTLGNQGNIRINDFIEHGLDDNTYYSFLCDDDFYERGFFDKIAERTPKESVIVVSMHRGDRFSLCGGRPTYTLPAAPQNMKENVVGLEQLIIRGDILKNLRLDVNNACADGLLARELKEQGVPINYMMDVFVLFNYLEKGRYESISLLP
jgi:hypothetical protein